MQLNQLFYLPLDWLVAVFLVVAPPTCAAVALNGPFYTDRSIYSQLNSHCHVDRKFHNAFNNCIFNWVQCKGSFICKCTINHHHEKNKTDQDSTITFYEQESVSSIAATTLDSSSNFTVKLLIYYQLFFHELIEGLAGCWCYIALDLCKSP